VTSLGIAVPAVTAAIVAGSSVRVGARRSPHRQGQTYRAKASTASVDWATFLDAAASGVRAGHSLTVAVEQARNHSGIPTTGIRARVPADRSAVDADHAVAQQALQVAAELGGPVASALQHAADLLRERHAMRAEARAHAAQARLSAAVLTLLPVAFAVLGVLTSQSYRQAVGSTSGVVLTIAGLVSNLTGWRWMQRTIVGATR